MIKELLIYKNLYKKLIADQYSSPDDPLDFYGMFGKNRPQDQIIKFTIEVITGKFSKPQMFQTLSAIQTLKLLERETSKHIINKAGDFVENRFEENGIIKVDEIIVSPTLPSSPKIVRVDHYRHSIAGGIILLTLERRMDLVRKIIKILLENNIQNSDHGWPLANKPDDFRKSDLWSSAYAIQFLTQYLEAEKVPQEFTEKIEKTIDDTFKYFEAKSNDWFWWYKTEDDRIDATAYLYVMLYDLLKRRNTKLLEEIPYKMSKYFLPNKLLYIDGLQTDELFRKSIRVAYALNLAATDDRFNIDSYNNIKKTIINNYSHDKLYDAYDICCLMRILMDKWNRGVYYSKELLGFYERTAKYIPLIWKPFKEIHGIIKKSSDN